MSEVKRATTPDAFDFRREQMLWDFAEEDTLEHWDCISDHDMHGHSLAKLEPNGKGRALQEFLYTLKPFPASQNVPVHPRNWSTFPWQVKHGVTIKQVCSPQWILCNTSTAKRGEIRISRSRHTLWCVFAGHMV